MDYQSKVVIVIFLAIAAGYGLSESMVVEYYVEKVKSVFRNLFS